MAQTQNVPDPPRINIIMERVELQSASLKTAAYQQQGAWLELEFRNGTIYRYFRVPVEIYQELLQAQSKGQYFNQHIRNRFPTIKTHPSGSRTITLPRHPGTIL